MDRCRGTPARGPSLRMRRRRGCVRRSRPEGARRARRVHSSRPARRSVTPGWPRWMLLRHFGATSNCFSLRLDHRPASLRKRRDRMKKQVRLGNTRARSGLSPIIESRRSSGVNTRLITDYLLEFGRVSISERFNLRARMALSLKAWKGPK